MFNFGSAANTQSSAGTLFGATPSTSGTASAFGHGNPSNTAAGTLFSSNTTNSPAAGTLFGGSTSTAPASSNTGFGSPFGSTPAFGAASTSLAGGFGGTSTAAAPGGFGATISQPAAATSSAFGSFGSAAATTQPAATTGFGNLASTPATSTAGGFSGFGTAPATSTAGGFGGFGTTPATSAAGGFGGFGATPATSTFGTSTATSTGGFGASTAAKPAFGSFGNNSLFGAKPQQSGFTSQQPQTGFGNQQQQQLGPPPPVQEKVWQNLALIRAHFDPTSPLCQFRHYFYNMVPPNEVHLYVRPQNQDEQLWNEAQRKNPDPTTMVPVLAVGFDDILKRMEIQSKQLELHRAKLRETAERLASVKLQYESQTLVKLEEHKRRLTDFGQRLLRLLRYSQVLRYKNLPLSADEEKTMETLNRLSKLQDRPEIMNQKLMVVRNKLQAIKARKMADEHGGESSEVWRAVNDDDLDIIAKVLEDEQKGIKHVTNILESDTKELDLIESTLKDHRKSNDTNMSSRQ
ncbi:nucleoporin complex subunit 54-domain-containing protein [Parasitella parasitica]|nr:nucleoporin complex subunit 54-domain-containing protein [Parasitella parasitica]